MKIKQAVTLISGLLLTPSLLLTAEAADRWFEVEVILVSQLGDKTQLKENFSGEVSLPTYRRSYDLLSAYLNPDIKTLKQQLPNCQSPQYPVSLVEQASKPESFPKLLSLDEIKLLPYFPELDERNRLDDETISLNENLTIEGVETNQINAEINEQFPSTNTTVEQSENSTELLGLTKEENALVIAAEQEFSAFQFDYADITLPQKNLCTITEQAFNALKLDSHLYSYLGFTTYEMPKSINGVEDLYSKTPYLVSQDSLKLHDIVKQLRLSRNFRPLLHVGWRQPVYSERRARAVKLFAGNSLEANFTSAQQEFKQELLNGEENSITDILQINQHNGETKLPQEELLKQAKAQHLQKIIDQINTINQDDNEAIIAQLNQAITLDLPVNELMMQASPTLPLQPWFIDGFVRIHLHRNYLNITADFNILNQTLAEQETERLKPTNEKNDLSITKQINFKQRRRVISTQTHYFDHPYMGMFVQIRRHKQAEHPVEEPNTEQ